MALCANVGFMRVDIHLGLALDPNEHWCGLGGSPKEPGDSIRSRDTGRSAGNSNTVSYCKEWARLGVCRHRGEMQIALSRWADDHSLLQTSRTPKRGRISRFRIFPTSAPAAGPGSRSGGTQQDPESQHADAAVVLSLAMARGPLRTKQTRYQSCCAVRADVLVLYTSISKNFRRARRKKSKLVHFIFPFLVHCAVCMRRDAE